MPFMKSSVSGLLEEDPNKFVAFTFSFLVLFDVKSEMIAYLISALCFPNFPVSLLLGFALFFSHLPAKCVVFRMHAIPKESLTIILKENY